MVVVDQAAVLCSRRQELLTRIARLAAEGTSLAHLSDLAVDTLASQAGVRPAVARLLLVSATESSADVEVELQPDLRAFVEALASVLALARRLETIRSLMDSLPEVIVRFDADLRCVYVNASGERLLGLPAHQLYGLPASALGLPDPHRAALELAMHLTLRTRHEQHLQMSVPGAIHQRVFDTRLSPEVTADDQVQAIVSVWRELN